MDAVERRYLQQVLGLIEHVAVERSLLRAKLRRRMRRLLQPRRATSLPAMLKRIEYRDQDNPQCHWPQVQLGPPNDPWRREQYRRMLEFAERERQRQAERRRWDKWTDIEADDDESPELRAVMVVYREAGMIEAMPAWAKTALRMRGIRL